MNYGDLLLGHMCGEWSVAEWQWRGGTGNKRWKLKAIKVGVVGLEGKVCDPASCKAQHVIALVSENKHDKVSYAEGHVGVSKTMWTSPACPFAPVVPL